MSASLLGIDPTAVHPAAIGPQFKVGAISGYDHPTLGYQEFIYGTATAAVTGPGFACVEGVLNGNFSMVTTANTAAGQLGGHGSRVGAAQAVLAAGDSGWFQVLGRGSLRVLASAAIGTRLNTTATAGALDDDATASSRAINGVVLKTAAGGAAETNTDARFSYPTVGATL